MNTDTNSYREKGRAVFLAAIMVLSMVAGVAVFGAAPAAAQAGVNSPDLEATPVHFEQPSDNKLGTSISAGNGVIELVFDEGISSINQLNVTTEAGAELDLTSDASHTSNGQVVVDTGEVRERVDEVLYNVTGSSTGNFTDDSASVTFAGQSVEDTDDVNVFEGTTIAIVNGSQGNSVEITSESEFASRSAPSDGQVATFNTNGFSLEDYEISGDVNANFTLRDLGLEASVSGDEFFNDEEVTGTVSSVSDDREILVQVVDTDTETTVNLGGDATADFSVGPLDNGDYSIQVTDLASGVTAETGSFTVGEAPEGSVAFAEGTTQVPTGDNGEVTVNFGGGVTETTVEIGANRNDYGFNFTLTDEDGSGSATFVLNTFEMNDTSGGVGTVVTAPGDGSSVSNFQDGGDGQGSAADRLSPIQLRMAAVSSADQDRAQLVLTERETESLSTHIAPEGSLPSDLGDLDGEAVENFIQDVQTPSETVAEGDDLVFLIQANGIFSYVNESSLASGGDGVSFTLTQQDSGLQSPAEFSTGDDAIEGVFFDEDDERAVVVADSTNSTLADGGVFEASFSIDGASNPYVEDEGAGVEEEVTSEVEVVEPEISFDIVDGDTYEVVPEDGAQVFGSTNLAPGTPVTVNAAGDFFVTNDTEVTEDGFVSTFDFQSGVDDLNTDQEFELSADGGLVSADATGTFADTPEDEQQTDAAELEQQVAELEAENANLTEENTALQDEIDNLTEELSTVEDERANLQNELANAEATIGDLESQVSDLESQVSDLESTNSDLESQVSELEGANEDLQTVFDELGVDNVDDAVSEIQNLSESGDSDDSGPGFGIAAALVALIAAALLAVRRRD